MRVKHDHFPRVPEKIHSFQRKGLKRIFGPVGLQANVIGRILYSEELYTFMRILMSCYTMLVPAWDIEWSSSHQYVCAPSG
jgi:hypothetical protein